MVVSTAVLIQSGKALAESSFSGGRHAGHANAILEKLGFVIVPKGTGVPALPLELHGRYGRREIYATVGIAYDQQQRHLNVGLSPQCKDGGYFIFITLNKEELDPAHDYDDPLFADQFVWVTRRGVEDTDPDYVNLRDAECRVSLFVRTNPGEQFLYAGELHYQGHKPISDQKSKKPQLEFIWDLRNPLPDTLLQELTLGLPSMPSRAKRPPTDGRPSRGPSSFNELMKDYSYALGIAERTVVPEHQHYQVRLKKYLSQHGVTAEMEKDFVDVSFSLEGEDFVGEIKVTRSLTLPQAFRASLGQILDYAHLMFDRPPRMIIFLDQKLDDRRTALACSLGIAVVVEDGDDFLLMNSPGGSNSLQKLFALNPHKEDKT